MIRTIGMIGAGNMGSAILRGIVEAEYVRASQIIAFDTNRKRMRELEEDLPGVITASDCLEVAEQADLIILAVKPIYMNDVIDEIRPRKSSPQHCSRMDGGNAFKGASGYRRRLYAGDAEHPCACRRRNDSAVRRINLLQGRL